NESVGGWGRARRAEPEFGTKSRPHPDRRRLAPAAFHPLPQGERVMAWRASVLTILPEMFPGPLGVSLSGKALKSGLWSLEIVDIRDFAADKHRSVDDTPAGGGPGLGVKPDGPPP